MPGFDSWTRAVVFMRLGDLMVILSEGIPFCPFGRVSVALTSWHCCSPERLEQPEDGNCVFTCIPGSQPHT